VQCLTISKNQIKPVNSDEKEKALTPMAIQKRKNVHIHSEHVTDTPLSIVAPITLNSSDESAMFLCFATSKHVTAACCNHAYDSILFSEMPSFSSIGWIDTCHSYYHACRMSQQQTVLAVPPHPDDYTQYSIDTKIRLLNQKCSA
jgi:hypothetical protein